ncbi:hypothetical protein [Christiangramia aquimixticola]|uniref:hypothetical protein n=1 Tax=Christiangramia aquimixticola TaxID=1697558 RepID=UPI003AA9A367
MLAYYAHQHGSGHSKFADLFAEFFKSKQIILTSFDHKFSRKSKVIILPSENPDGTTRKSNQVAPPDYLHYSPVGQRSIQLRSSLMLQSLLEHNTQLLIVDVSAEVAALARAASFPYAYVRLPGVRNDEGHLQAFKAATFLLAYYPERFEDESVPDWVRNKTIYLGFIFGEKLKYSPKTQCEEVTSIVVISGKGGNENLNKYLPLLLDRFLSAHIKVLGIFEEQHCSSRLEFAGFVDKPEVEINKAQLVVANCGLNTVSELTGIPVPFIAIAEKRPYEEQKIMQKALVNLDLAIDPQKIFELSDKEILSYTKTYNTNGMENLKTFKTLLENNLFSLPSLPKLFRKSRNNK